VLNKPQQDSSKGGTTLQFLREKDIRTGVKGGGRCLKRRKKVLALVLGKKKGHPCYASIRGRAQGRTGGTPVEINEESGTTAHVEGKNNRAEREGRRESGDLSQKKKKERVKIKKQFPKGERRGGEIPPYYVKESCSGKKVIFNFLKRRDMGSSPCMALIVVPAKGRGGGCNSLVL